MDIPKVSSKITVKSLEAQSEGHDPWRAFRQIEIVQLELVQQYKHSPGKVSRFFIELENQRFMGTVCRTCNRVYTPPRPLCPDCLKITEWLELSGYGILETYSIMHFSNGINDDVNALEMPFILAYVLLDGSSTLFPHILKCNPQKVYSGMPVKVAYTGETVSHPIHLMSFVPTEE